MRLLIDFPFFGVLLTRLKFALTYAIDNGTSGAATDGTTIYFNPEQLEAYKPHELEIITMHELLHVVLKHVLRQKDRDSSLFNSACDIVVNSMIYETLGCDENRLFIQGRPLIHKLPNGEEGSKHSAEEIYEILLATLVKQKKKDGKSGGQGGGSGNDGDGSDDDADGENGNLDDHSRWGQNPHNVSDKLSGDLIDKMVIEAFEAAQNRKSAGNIPQSLLLEIGEIKEPQIDWRVILNNFVQTNIIDYSFIPPDRRFSDSDFILPDFNVPENVVKNILFMVDTSGSMSKKDITDCYTEIKGAIDTYNGKLEGYLGFFDACVKEIKPFEQDFDVTKVKPTGGGGTDFSSIFKYINENMSDMEIESIIILTDGYASFPDESEAKGIPVLWVINNKEQTPPFGKIARINVHK